MSDVLECIYHDAYNAALNGGASDKEARDFAESCKEDTAEYLELYYI